MYECPVCKRTIFNRYVIHASTRDEPYETKESIVVKKLDNTLNFATNRKYDIFKLDYTGTVIQQNNILFAKDDIYSETSLELTHNLLESDNVTIADSAVLPVSKPTKLIPLLNEIQLIYSKMENNVFYDKAQKRFYKKLLDDINYTVKVSQANLPTAGAQSEVEE
jgi:hypothetical protein